MRFGQKKPYLSDPLCVSSKSVDTGSCRQGPDFYSEVCWAADQGVQLINVVYAEYCNKSKTFFMPMQCHAAMTQPKSQQWQNQKHKQNLTDLLCAISWQSLTPTCPSMSSELLDFGTSAPFPACNGVVKRSCYQFLLIKFDSGTSVGLNAVDALPCANIP